MKVRKLGVEWGAAFEKAQPVRITHGDANLIVFVSEKGDLIVQTVHANWHLTSDRDGDASLTLES